MSTHDKESAQIPSVDDAASSSADVDHDYQRNLKALLSPLPEIRERLAAKGVAFVRIVYYGCGDEGSFDSVEYCDVREKDMEIDDYLVEKVESILQQLMLLRHERCGTVEGACGEFFWNMEDRTLTHEYGDLDVEPYEPLEESDEA
jgi:hypothetical protein